MTPVDFAVLHQLFTTAPVEDGNIICKSGRNDLIKAGLAVRKQEGRLAVTRLTPAGKALAARMSFNVGHA